VIAQALHPPSIWQWIGDHGSAILSQTAEHVELTVITVLIGAVLSLPLAILA